MYLCLYLCMYPSVCMSVLHVSSSGSVTERLARSASVTMERRARREEEAAKEMARTYTFTPRVRRLDVVCSSVMCSSLLFLGCLMSCRSIRIQHESPLKVSCLPVRIVTFWSDKRRLSNDHNDYGCVYSARSCLLSFPFVCVDPISVILTFPLCVSVCMRACVYAASGAREAHRQFPLPAARVHRIRLTGTQRPTRFLQRIGSDVCRSLIVRDKENLDAYKDALSVRCFECLLCVCALLFWVFCLVFICVSRCFHILLFSVRSLF